MRKILYASLAAMLAASSGSAAFAQQRQHHGYQDRDNYVRNYCDDHGWDRGCRDWRDNRYGWDNNDYRRWYRNHYHDHGPEDAMAAIFGFAAGAITGAITGSQQGSHVARCEARYNSYNPRTDQYLGYDGQYHYCRL